MAENSKIEWTKHTFNPWIGCQKVGPGCDHCYAEAMMDTRLGRVEWGPHAARSRTSASYWQKPLAWDKAAKAAGERHRVFCASLADVFDNHKSIENEWRRDLWCLIRATPNLDWMLLTKRPGNIAKMLPEDWGQGYPNVWLGCTIVNQQEADRDIPKLLSVPAAIHFLSMEPLLGPVDLTLDGLACKPCQTCADGSPDPETGLIDCSHCDGTGKGPDLALDLVIVGGESGPGARYMLPSWALSLRDQCVAAGVSFHFKQWGEFRPPESEAEWKLFREGKGYYGSLMKNGSFGNRLGDGVLRVGKKAAGRLLNGRTWDEMPGSRGGA